MFIKLRDEKKSTITVKNLTVSEVIIDHYVKQSGRIEEGLQRK